MENPSLAADANQNGKDSKTTKRKMDNKTNLTVLTWAHAVNNQKQLTDAFHSNVDFIEADIVIGKIKNAGPNLPIMAHPPIKTSDLSLESFLSQIKEHNENTEKIKGVKLDFKSTEVFEDALEILKRKIPEIGYPIWLNADIIEGPVNEKVTRPVNPDKFFAGCAQFEKVVLSIGWTTNWSSIANDGSYTREEINSMLEAIKKNNVACTGQSITFPVRAGIAANSLSELQDLLEALRNDIECTLTIWSSQNDFVNVDKLRNLILSIGIDRVYLDVPKELYTQLGLSQQSV